MEFLQKEIKDKKWNLFLEWNPCPIIQLDLNGNILFLNLAARALFPALKNIKTQHPLINGLLKKMQGLFASQNDLIVYSQEVTITNVIYEVKCMACPAEEIIFVHLVDISHEIHAEKELNILNKELEQRVINRTAELNASREKAEELSQKAVAANRLKSEFLANMSHELRTPLNGIIGFTELMYYEKVGKISEDHKEYLNDILTSSRHLLQLINDILDLSKIEAGVIEFRPKQINLEEITNEVLDSLHPLIIKKNIQVEKSISQSLSDIFIDPGKLKQILYNYLSNAIKFSPNGGKVSVNITPKGKQYFKLAIKDRSIGIQRESLNKLFVEFQQLDIGAAKKYQGTGLGLALTKRIVEAQGGKVGVESTYGIGSTFFAVLPRKMAIDT